MVRRPSMILCRNIHSSNLHHLLQRHGSLAMHTLNKKQQLFAHLFDAGQDTQVARNVLLSYELTSIPRSLEDADGAKHANKKADLLHILSNLATDIILPQQCTHIIDAMDAATYSELAVQVFLLMIKGT